MAGTTRACTGRINHQLGDARLNNHSDKVQHDMPLNPARIAFAILLALPIVLLQPESAEGQTSSVPPPVSSTGTASAPKPETDVNNTAVQGAETNAGPGGASETDPHVPEDSPPLFTNDAVVFGMLIGILALVFWTHSLKTPFLVNFYKFVPMLLLCYFLPSLLTTFGIVDPEISGLPSVAKKYLLPASLVLLTLSIDLNEVLKLGPKALIMFLTGTIGVIVGGPLAILLVGSFDPVLVGGHDSDAVWRGLATVAGSWIGGGANQVAMKEIFNPNDGLFSVMLAVDIVIGELWMVFLLLGIGKASQIDRILKADSSSVRELQEKMEQYSLTIARNPSVADLFVILGVGFGVTACCHIVADVVAPFINDNFAFLSKFSLNSSFFWLIVLATTGGLLLSFTKARQLEGAGASKVGTVCIFFLVATIGLHMDILAVFEYPGLFLVGGIWMLIHVGLMVVVAKVIRAPYFFLAVGSKANIGGAASAPVVAAAFHPSLAPVGVLLAVVGYALGTYGAYICALMMQAVAPS